MGLARFEYLGKKMIQYLKNQNTKIPKIKQILENIQIPKRLKILPEN